MSLHRIAALALATALAAGLAGAAERTVDETHPLAAGGVVRVENLAGSVVVTGWERAEVGIRGTLGKGVRGLAVEASDAELEVEVELEGRRDGRAELELMVPAGATVEVATVSADIGAVGLVGELALESVSGSVEVSGRPHRLDAGSVSGVVRVEVAPDRCHLETVSGGIEVGDAVGRLDVETVSGVIRIGLGGVSRTSVESVSGNVGLAGELAAGGVLDVETMSGDVELTLPAGLSAEVELSTYSGTIRSALGPAPRSSGGAGSGSELRFVAGAGDGRVVVSTFSGSIALKTR